jgi:beta-glucosidase
MEAALAAARNADVVVMVLGISPRLEGEEMKVEVAGFLGGDRTSLDLPAPQQELLEEVAKTRKPIVVVLLNGSALAVNWAQEHASAILEAWYPGEEGGTAIAETLAGGNNPAGRLPVTFYKTVADLPPFTDYAMQGRTYRYFKGQALYRFGDGLSYSRFVYRNARFTREMVISVEVENISERSGDEVIQVYLSSPRNPQFTPIRKLVGFQRVSLKAHEKQRVAISISPDDLTGVDEQGRRVALKTGVLDVGGHQPGPGTVRVEFVDIQQ